MYENNNFMKINFYIESRNKVLNANSDHKFPVVLSCAYNGKRMKMHTGIRISPVNWNKDTMRINGSYEGSMAINSYIDTMEEICKKAFGSLSDSHSVPEPGELRDQIKKIKPLSCIGFFDAFIKFMEDNNSRWQKSTYLKVKSLYRLLREYDEKQGHILQLPSFNDISFDEISSFLKYSKKYSDITVSRYLGIIKWFLKWAEKKKYYFNPGNNYIVPKINPENTKDNVSKYLVKDEIMKLYEQQDLLKKEERVRDIFIFLCFTGLTYAELCKLSKSDIQDDYIILHSYKPARHIPLNQISGSILKKYQYVYFKGNTVFPVYSVMTINKYLRIIAGKAGLTRRIHITPGSGEIDKSEDLYMIKNMITVGFARNTFLMNALLLGIPEESVKRLAGIRTQYVIKRFKDHLAAADRQEMGKFNTMLI